MLRIEAEWRLNSYDWNNSRWFVIKGSFRYTPQPIEWRGCWSPGIFSWNRGVSASRNYNYREDSYGPISLGKYLHLVSLEPLLKQERRDVWMHGPETGVPSVSGYRTPMIEIQDVMPIISGFLHQVCPSLGISFHHRNYSVHMPDRRSVETPFF